jgi:tRNA uridine 5-carbamoylmethylation protein Kti12
MKKKIYIMKGLPGCGKSTLARNMIENSSDTVRLNKDDIRKMLGGTFTNSKENAVLEMRDFAIGTLLSKNYNVIVDDTNLHPKHEATIREKFGDKADIEIVSLLDVPLEECLKRDRNRVERVGEAVIMDMYRKFVKPIPVVEYDHSLPSCIIVDMDGTLAIKGDRDIYDFSKVGVDIVNQSVERAVRGFIKAEENDCYIIVVSGRDDSCKEITRQWIHDKTSLTCTSLFMRETGDKRPDYIIKQEIYDTWLKGRYNVLAVFDDRDSVVRMWRDNGLPVFQVNEGNF